MRHFWIRVDASKRIGTGHVVRCLTVAHYLAGQGKQVTFICRLLGGNLISMIQAQGFRVITLAENFERVTNQQAEMPLLRHHEWLESSQEQDAQATLLALQGEKVTSDDWLLIDHFALDYRWETFVGKQLPCHVAVIDGQADRKHMVDVLVDPTLCQSDNKWFGLLEYHTRLFQGITYAPIRSEFFEYREKAKVRTRLSNILVAFGGVDLPNYTLVALQVLLSLPIPNITINVVVGMNSPHINQLKEFCDALPNVTLYQQISNIHELMYEADLSIGAGGTSAWERCMLYLPTLVAVIADNQQDQATCLEQNGVAWSMGGRLENFPVHLTRAMKLLIDWPSILNNMSLSAKWLTKSMDRDVWGHVFEENKVNG